MPDALGTLAGLFGLAGRDAKPADWDALVAALVTRGLVAELAIPSDDEEDVADDATDAAAFARTLAAAKCALPADAWAWVDPAKHDGYTAEAFVRAAAVALSSMGIGIVRVVVPDARRCIVALVPWAARAKLVAAGKAAQIKGHRVVAIGPAKPAAKPRAAKPLPAKLHRKKLANRWTERTLPAHADGFYLGTPKHTLELIDLAAWPPKHVPIAPFQVAALAIHARTGARAIAGLQSAGKSERTPVLELGGRPLALPGALEMKDLEQLGFLGDDLIALPTVYAYRGDDRHLAPLRCPAGKHAFTAIGAKELPPTKVKMYKANADCDFLRHGFARTGDGADVLLWEGGGYTGRPLARRFELPKAVAAGAAIPTAPLAGDAFAVLASEQLYEVRAGTKPVARLAGPIDGCADGISAAPGGALLVRLIRRERSTPLLVAWWPAERTYAKVPAKLFGMRGGDWFAHHGVSTGGLAWGFEEVEEELRALPWSAIAALPRVSE